VSGFFGAERIATLYGISDVGKDLEILMRHRAILFGILGAFFVYAAFNAALQPLAFIAAACSLSSFFYLAFSVGDYNNSIGRVVIADYVATAALLGAVILYFLKDK
jgi:4-hydroxybenzoate polyprenyltransferase